MDNGRFEKIVRSGYRSMKIAVFLVKRIGTIGCRILLAKKERIKGVGNELGEK